MLLGMQSSILLTVSALCELFYISIVISIHSKVVDLRNHVHYVYFVDTTVIRYYYSYKRNHVSKADHNNYKQVIENDI